MDSFGYIRSQNIGEISQGEKSALSILTPTLIIGGAAYVAMHGLIQSGMTSYFLGIQRNRSWKIIAKRNAALGAAGGLFIASMLGYSFHKN